jgi:hypothetical protein
MTSFAPRTVSLTTVANCGVRGVSQGATAARGARGGRYVAHARPAGDCAERET